MKNDAMSRRAFLKATAASAAALSVPYVFVRRSAAAYEPGQTIHPNISPLRVVGLHDPNMTTDQRVNNSWHDQETLLNADLIRANVDRLACALAQEKDTARAWKKILIKPAGKAWSDVVVAIKTNNIAEQHTRSPVMARVCHALTDVLGVRGHNVHIYDACHGADIVRKSPFVGLPEGARIEGRWGGSVTPVPVPGPWRNGDGQSPCLTHLAEGQVDILINIALCKAHNSGFGGFTMSLKNHFGTFTPKLGHQSDGTGYLIAINKSSAILGEVDSGTGKIAFPRQQLCLIDCLWASKGGPGGNPSDQPNRLFMSAFGPALDYQVATKFRRDAMRWPINEGVAERFLTESGFAAADLPEGGRIIDAMKYAG